MSSVEAEVSSVLDDIISKIEVADRSRRMVAHQGAATAAASRDVAAAFQAGSKWMGKVGGAFGKSISSKRALLKSSEFKMPSFKAPEFDVDRMCGKVCDATLRAASSASSAASGLQERLQIFSKTQESWQLSAMITSLCELDEEISRVGMQSPGICILKDICPIICKINIPNKYSKLVEAYTPKKGYFAQYLTKDFAKYLTEDLDEIWNAKYITREEIVERVLNLPSPDKSSQDRRNSLYSLSLRCNSPAKIFKYWVGKVSELLDDVERETILADATYWKMRLADATYWKMRLAIEIVRNCLLPLSQQNIQPDNKFYNFIPEFIKNNFVRLDKSLIKFGEDSATIKKFNSLVKSFNSDFVSCTDQVLDSMDIERERGITIKAAIAKEVKKAEEKRKLEAFKLTQAEAAAEQLKKDEARKQEEATEEAREAQKEQDKQKACEEGFNVYCGAQILGFWMEWGRSSLLSSNLAGVVDIPKHIKDIMKKRDEFENLAKINWQSFLYSEDDFKADSLSDPINAMDKARSNYDELSKEIGLLQKFVYEQRFKLHARWQRSKVNTSSVFKVYEGALANMQESLDKAYKNTASVFKVYEGALANMQESLGEAYNHAVSKQHDLLSPAIMGAVSSCYNDIVESLEQKDLKERDFVDISKEMQTDIAKFSSFNEKLSQAHDEFFFHDDICQQAWMAYLDVLNMQYRIKLSGDVFRAPDISAKGETYQKFYQYVSQIPQVADIDLFTLRDFDVLYEKSKSSYVKLDILLQEAQSLRRLNILKYEGDSAQFSLLNLDDKFESRALEITPLQTQAVGSWVQLSRNLSKIERLKDKSVSPAILEEYISHTRRNFQQQSNAYKRLTDSFIFVDPCANTSLSRDASSPLASDEDSASARPHAFFGEASKDDRSSPLAQEKGPLSSNDDIQVAIDMPNAQAPEFSARQRISAAVVKNKYKFITSAALLVVGAGAMIAAPYIAAAAFVTVAIVAGCVALGVGGALGLLGCVSSACAFRNSTREGVAEAVAQAEV